MSIQRAAVVLIAAAVAVAFMVDTIGKMYKYAGELDTLRTRVWELAEYQTRVDQELGKWYSESVRQAAGRVSVDKQLMEAMRGDAEAAAWAVSVVPVSDLRGMLSTWGGLHNATNPVDTVTRGLRE